MIDWLFYWLIDWLTDWLVYTNFTNGLGPGFCLLIRELWPKGKISNQQGSSKNSKSWKVWVSPINTCFCVLLSYRKILVNLINSVLSPFSIGGWASWKYIFFCYFPSLNNILIPLISLVQILNTSRCYIFTFIMFTLFQNHKELHEKKCSTAEKNPIYSRKNFNNQMTSKMIPYIIFLYY